jgi:OFA family oxalate/formate antiporter-like MFS transporter
MNLALGSLYAWSVFVAPLEKQFGWKRADTSMVFTIAVAVFALTFVVAGRIQDKIGPFYCSLTGGILVSLGFFLCSYTTSLTYLFICFGVIGGLGNGFGYATPIPVMAKWFPDKRGLAVGLAVGGYGAGSAIFGPLAQLKLIPAYGLATTFQILGVIFLVMTMIGAFLLKNPPAGYKPAGWVPATASKAAATTHDFSPGEVLRTPTFYLMWVAYALGCSAGLMVISQMVFGLDVRQTRPHQRAARDDRDFDGGHADSIRGGRQRGVALRDGIRGLLVLRDAAFRERRGYGGFLGHQEREHQLRNAVHRVGRGRHHRRTHRREVV